MIFPWLGFHAGPCLSPGWIGRVKPLGREQVGAGAGDGKTGRCAD
jgi:hypothetical protein